MPKGTSVKGAFTARAVLSVVEQAANAITFQKLETGLGVQDAIGWLIERIDWTFPAGTYGLFNSSGDYLNMALTMTNTLTAAQLSLANAAVYAEKVLTRVDIGTAASGFFVDPFYRDDYSTLDGGGLLVLPNPLYLAVVGSGLSGPASPTAILYYKQVELSDQDYINLIQSRQLLIQS